MDQTRDSVIGMPLRCCRIICIELAVSSRDAA